LDFRVVSCDLVDHSFGYRHEGIGTLPCVEEVVS